MFPNDLKKSIIQYAIEGKLVKQDINEGSAKVLIEDIIKTKEQLIKNKVIKKDKFNSYIYRDNNRFFEESDNGLEDITDQLPFEIPESWEWVRFGSIFNFKLGKSPPSNNSKYWSDEGTNWLSISDLNDNFLGNSKKKITKEAIDEIFKTQPSPTGTLIMSFKLTIGKTAFLTTPSYHNEAIISIFSFNNNCETTEKMLYYFLPLITNYGNKKEAIKGNTLNSESIYKLFIPIPPLNEQKRIVEKIEEILPLITQYKYNYDKLKELENNIKPNLKRSIIQYAIEGKLVEQDINEGSAKSLIEDIIKTKEQLIKDKVIKKDKFNSYIYRDNNRFFEKNDNGIKDITDQLPFEIPESWEWVRLGSVFEINSGLNFKKSEIKNENKNNVRVLRGGNIQNNLLVFNNDDLFISKECIKNQNLFIKKNSLITPVSSGQIELLGKTALIDEEYNDIVFGGFLYNLNTFLNEPTLSKYFYFLTFTDFYKNTLKGIKNGTMINNIPKTKFQTVFIPIPPLGEQKRIVEKIEEIFNIIDKIQE